MGPKKRKGKMANKLAAMSDEERERYLQHRAALQEEKRRRKEQLVATFIRNKLKREEAYTRINTAKINQNWRQLLRKIKSKELQQEVECMWHTFGRHVERREANIAELLRALDLAERQYGDMLQAHLEAVERLEKVHLEHLSDTRALFSARLDDLIHKSMAEMAEIQVSHEGRKRAIETILSAMIDAIPARNYARYQKKVRAEELRQKLESECEAYVDDREQKLESLWLETKDVLTKHISKTAAKRKVVKKLQAMDHDWIVELEDLDRRTLQLSRVNQLGERRLAELKQTTDDLTIERNESHSCYQALQAALDRDLKRDAERFRKMTICSQQAIKDLQALQTQGEKIMTATNLVSRLETDKERQAVVNMIGKSDSKSSLDTDVSQKSEEKSDQESSASENIEQIELKLYAKLDNFWLRYNKVNVEISTARIKRDVLLLENNQLRTKLRDYVSSIARAPPIHAQRPIVSSRSSFHSDGCLTATVSEVSHG